MQVPKEQLGMQDTGWGGGEMGGGGWLWGAGSRHLLKI